MSNAPAAATDAVTQPDRIAALRSALPADLSHSPLLGILAVIMGAGIASLAARLLSLGLADLRGHIGIGVDEGAWIGTAFNAATMFIGPLTVYLGAMLGARRVLLVCSGVFAIVSACLPFAHSYSLLIVLLAIAGLSSGTFYPLTHQLRAAERSAQVPGAHARRVCDMYRGRRELCAIALRLLSGSPVVGRGCSGRPRSSRRSWRRASTTAFRRLARPRPSGPKPSFAGFLYASAGLALLFAALDQGQRLDWWRSGVFTALVRVRSVLPVCARSSAVCARRTLWSICHTCASGTRSPWHSGCFRLPVRAAGDGPGHPAVAVGPRSRRRAVRSSRAVDGGAGVVSSRSSPPTC